MNDLHAQTSHYMIAAVGVVAALAWKELVQHLFDRLFPKMRYSIALLLQAIILTVILMILIQILPDTSEITKSATAG